VIDAGEGFIETFEMIRDRSCRVDVKRSAVLLCKGLQGNIFAKKLPVSVGKAVHGSLLDEARLFEGHVSTVFVDGLERAAAQFDADKLLKFRDPDPFVLEVWGNRAFGDFGDVTTDTAFFLGQARTMDFAAGADAGASDATNTCHDEKLVSGARRMPWVSGASSRIVSDIEEFLTAKSTN
jgi:hypothetical protein